MNTETTKNAYETRLDSATIIHFTFVGSLAGRPYCGASRDDAGAMFVHAVHAHKSTFNHPKLCPTCKALWDESAND